MPEDKEIIPVIIGSTTSRFSVDQLFDSTGFGSSHQYGTAVESDNLIKPIYISPSYNFQPEETVKKKFKFDWEGGLREEKQKIGSVELQHKVSEWR